jgi:hypothetical protein
MAEGGFKTYALAVAQMIWGIGVNLFLILPVVLAAVLVANYLSGEAFTDLAKVNDPANKMMNLTFLVAGVLLVAVLILPIIQNLGRNAGAENQQLRVFSTRYENCCIGLLVALFGLLLWNLLPYGYALYHWLVYEWGGPQVPGAENRKTLLAAAAGAGPFLAGLLQFVGKKAGYIKKFGLVLLVISGPVFFLVAFFFLVDYFVVEGAKSSIWVLWLLLAVVLLYGFLLNINYTSPHRYYRRQLSRAYLMRRSRDGAEEAEHVDPQPLSGLTRPDDNGQTKAPYHFINCALNIPLAIHQVIDDRQRIGIPAKVPRRASGVPA